MCGQCCRVMRFRPVLIFGGFESPDIVIDGAGTFPHHRKPDGIGHVRETGALVRMAARNGRPDRRLADGRLFLVKIKFAPQFFGQSKRNDAVRASKVIAKIIIVQPRLVVMLNPFHAA